MIFVYACHFNVAHVHISLCRFHGIGCDNQKGVKDLLRMESDESDDEELDIENPSTPDNMSFHGGYDSPPPRTGDLPSRRDCNCILGIL